jgi:hypothetical protein
VTLVTHRHNIKETTDIPTPSKQSRQSADVPLNILTALHTQH